MRPHTTVVSDSYWRGVCPAHEQRWRAMGEPGNVADLGHEHRPQHRPDELDILDDVEAEAVPSSRNKNPQCTSGGVLLLAQATS
jgi:hypothetical protein